MQYIEHQNRSAVLLRASPCKPAAHVLGQILAMWRASLRAQAVAERVLLEGMKFIETRETHGAEVSALARDVKGKCVLNVDSYKVLWVVI